MMLKYQEELKCVYKCEKVQFQKGIWREWERERENIDKQKVRKRERNRK